MIYRLSKLIGTELKSKNFVTPVVFGPEHLTRSLGENVIVIERDTKGGDGFTPVTGAATNPRRLVNRMVGAQATLWIRSGRDGARFADHEDLCDTYVDALIVAIIKVMHRDCGMSAVAFSEARFLTQEEVKATVDAWPGVAYSLRWRVPRGVADLTYAGEGLPVGVVSATSNRVEVRRNADDTPTIVELP